MAQLAIRGHETCGKEVIEILEMLGGKNVDNYEGSNTRRYFFIKNNEIDWCHEFTPETNFITFTLEDFLAKFPYKVGDKVSSKFLKNCKIEKMKWTNITNRVVYNLQGIGWYSADELQPYKGENFAECVEATVQECLFGKEDTEDTSVSRIHCISTCKTIGQGTYSITSADGYKFDHIDENGNVIVKSIKPQYPKTYEECCEILSLGEDGFLYTKGYKSSLIQDFQKLLICRNSYLKIAGEENKGNIDYVICNVGGKIIKTNIPNSAYNHILNFPTEEMRDAFYENFKSLIEQCKELL